MARLAALAALFSVSIFVFQDLSDWSARRCRVGNGAYSYKMVVLAQSFWRFIKGRDKRTVAGLLSKNYLRAG